MRQEEDSPLGPVVWREELGSTNDEALERLARGESPPFVVWTGRQTAGRGQGTNRWWSTEGALTFSVAIAPDTYSLPVERWPCLALASAVAVCRAVDGWVSPHTGDGRGAAIKWPNDVWWGDRKLAGVLVERPRGAAGVDQAGQGGLVVGVGLNLNNRIEDTAIPGVKGVSVCEVDGREHPIEPCLYRLLDELHRAWGELGKGDRELAREWGRRSCLDGRRIRVRVGESVHEGICGGLAEDGTLRLWERNEATGLVGEARMVAGRVEILRDQDDANGW
jgi:BirA family biotin operon repressor/biotin-[acetyl-CoA-carboxylase] ligase